MFQSIRRMVRTSSLSASRSNRLRSRPGLESLERREVLSTNTFILDPVSHALTIWGSSGNDSAKVAYAVKPVTSSSGQVGPVTDTTTINITLNTDAGYQLNKSFATSDVTSIRYEGHTGTDIFTNATTIASTTHSDTGGTVNSTTLLGTPDSTDPGLSGQVGQFVVGSSGLVSIDYLYDGAGYRGQLGIFSLTGMDQYTPGTSAYNQEAARRALTDSTLGHVAISVQTETAKFEANLPWDGDFHNGHGSYLGPKNFVMTPGDKFGLMLVPNSTIQYVQQNPSAGGSATPLYSIPAANPYTTTSQLHGQIGDLDGFGDLFAFEDLRLDGGSDRDYNDMVLQVRGAIGYADPVSTMINTSRNFLTTSIFQSIDAYAAAQNTTLPGSSTPSNAGLGSFSNGVFQVGANGQVSVDFLYDGGAYRSQMAMFSLRGMSTLTPGSPEFIQEAARRALSDSTLGHVVIDKFTEGARSTDAVPWEKSWSQGTYQGVKTYAMVPGDQIGFLLVPAGTVWEAYSNPNSTDFKKEPLFSMPEANRPSALGVDQLASYDSTGKTFGFEDNSLASGSSDKDYEDVLFRLGGLTGKAPALATVVNSAKNLLSASIASKILA